MRIASPLAARRGTPNSTFSLQVPPASPTATLSAPVSTLVIVTVASGRTPAELSETVPSMVPFAACDCATAGAASDTESSAERRNLIILGVYNLKPEHFLRLAMESKHFVS